MIIAGLTLHNFKCFEGTHSVTGLAEDVSPEKPVILLGGLNGAGKTTFFEALLLCLYGHANTALWPSKGAKRENYLSYILSVTNNEAKTKKNYYTELWIQLDIDQVDIGGTEQSISIKRSWKIEAYKNRVDEKPLEIIQNGEPIPYFSEEEYENFIRNELIPQEISQFFLFDGEKIQDFVRDEDKEFARSFEAVLGISLYKQLQDDLATTRSRIVSKYNQDKNVRIELNKVEGEILDFETQIQDNEERIEDLITKIGLIDEEIVEIEAYTRRVTSLDVRTKEDYDSEKERLNKRKGALEERIFQAIQDDLPFVMTASLGERLKQQLTKEQELNQARSAQKAVQSKIDLIVHKLFDEQNSEPPLTIEQKGFYKRHSITILQEAFEVKLTEEVKVIHRLSDYDIAKINQRLNLTRDKAKDLPQNLNELQIIESGLSKIRQAEMKAMDEGVKELYEKRGQLLEKKRSIEEEIENCRTTILNFKEQIVSKKRKRTELEERATKTEKMQKQIEYCKQLREAINVFSHRFRARNVELLENFILKMWTRLIRKKDLVSRIEIDPERYFTINLYDMRGRLLDKTKLSAGEKEILAISLIWALSQLTNRSLPIVIDTPLGRLDSQHRFNIVSNYFPKASHQVIVLSSDEEITGKEYEAIAPFVSKHFLIEDGQDIQGSIIREGYFNINGYQKT